MDPSPTFFRHGTRHIAIGDSITHVGTYLFYLQLFALTRFPDRSIEFLNAGIAGDLRRVVLLACTTTSLPDSPHRPRSCSA